MKDFNFKKFILENPLTKNRKGINEAFEGFGGVKGIAPIQEAPVQPKDFDLNQDPWGWNEKDAADSKNPNKANAWMHMINRTTPHYKDWGASWEYPGIIVWSHPDIDDAVVAATPGWDGEGTPIEFQSEKGSTQMLKVLDQDQFPSFDAYVKAIAPYLDMVEDANLNPTGEKMSSDSDEFQGIHEKEVNETMTASKGWEYDDEDFPEEGYSNMDRMKGLVNQNSLKMFVTGARGIMGDLLDDGFEPDDVYEFLLDTLKNID